MAKHRVFADMGTFDVGMVDVVFKVKRDGALLGRLKVSQGGVEWQEGRAVNRVYQMGWKKFQTQFLAEGHGTKKPFAHGPLRRRHV
jgi:hypothetical protein